MTETAKHDGGPAFPNPYIEADPLERGMSLRDYLAGQALSGILAGICASPNVAPDEPCRERAYGRIVFSDAAKDAYTLADAMLAARAQGTARSA